MSESSKLPVQKLLAILVSPFAAIVLLLVAIVAALLYFGVSGPAIAAGAIVLVLAAGLFFVLWRLLDFERSPTGFTTLAALITFLGGVQLIGIGILGEYLGRIYDEVKRRPNYILKSAPPAGEGRAASGS